jgi:hypothetical protein
MKYSLLIDESMAVVAQSALHLDEQLVNGPKTPLLQIALPGTALLA